MSKYKAWKELERETRREFEKAGFRAKRLWDEQFEEGGGIDISATRDRLSFAIQCKYGKRPNFREAWTEANAAKKKNEIPLGLTRVKGERNTFVIISLKDFLSLLNSTLRG